MKYIGKRMNYLTAHGEMRFAVVQRIEFHEGLGKPIFIGISSYGNIVKLTREEIHSISK